MSHPALAQGRTAVVTGAASGIGLATAKALAARGMKLVLADLDAGQLEAARSTVQAATPSAEVMVEAVDVARGEDLKRLKTAAYAAFGEVNLLMNNAGIGMNPGKPWENLEGWRRLMEVNLWGAIHGVQAFVPAMLEGGGPGLVINTGSKQGITLPPGNSAYNVSKAGLKAYTELLAHELRQAAPEQLSAHLLIPGWTYTAMTSNAPVKPDGAWTSEQVAGFMLDRIEQGDFYILCPDNDTPRSLDEKRLVWSAGDIIENRPALSRWHGDYAEAFNASLRDD